MSKHQSPKDPPPAPDLTFEQALANLEAVIRDLEDGRLGLNESLGRYEEGVGLLKQCHAMLNQAERKILLLTGCDENGTAETQPFDDEALTLEEKSEQRRRRRSRPSAGGRAAPADHDDSADVQGDRMAEDEKGDVDRQKGLF